MNFADAPTVQRPATSQTGLDYSKAPLTQAPPPSHSFDDVSERLRLRVRDVCAHLLPGGRVVSGHYEIGDLAGNRGKSLKVDLGAGSWRDYAAGDSGGDLIALWAARFGLSQGDAKDEAAAWLGLPDANGAPPRKIAGQAKPPAPAQSLAEAPEDEDPNWWRRVEAAGKWTYADASGKPVAVVYRFNHPITGKKTIRPWDVARGEWKHLEGLRPLYNLPEILAAPLDRPVVLVEGEKTAEAVREVGYVATSMMGGAQAARVTDWTPLRGRNIIRWADADPPAEPGKARAADGWLKLTGECLAATGAASIRDVAVPAGKPPKWDAYDSLPEERKALIEAAERWPAETAKIAETGMASDVRAGSGAFGNFARGIPSEYEPFESLDLGLIGSGARAAPSMPTEVFGAFWAPLLGRMAERAGAPVDYVACSLLAGAASLIGDSRRVSAHAEWQEPCILWIGLVGNPSSGKSPARDRILSVLRQIELERARGFPELLRAWQTTAEAAKVAEAAWKTAVETAVGRGEPAPIKPASADVPPQPTAPRLIVNDATVEKLAYLLAAERRGLMLHCDELARLLGSFDRYGGAGSDRAFWLEAFGGRPYSVDRQKIPGQQPLYVPALMVSIIGGIQPDRLSSMLLKSDDDGLAARFLWTWPEPVPPTRPKESIDGIALEAALCKLSSLQPDQTQDGEPRPRVLPLTPRAYDFFHEWRIANAKAEAHLSGVTLSQHGKLPGLVMRIALVLEHLAWCGSGVPEPVDVSADSIKAAITLADQYFKPMAARVFGDAARPAAEKNAATIAKWMVRNKKRVINARDLRRTERLPGLSDSKIVSEALNVLGEAGWIRHASRPAGATGRTREDYEVNPAALGSS
jgi:putative DNA primase/helicase